MRTPYPYLNHLNPDARSLLQAGEPPSGLGGPIWGMQHARGEYIDYQIVSALCEYSEATVRDLDQDIGCGGTRIAGRCRSLVERGVLKRVERVADPMYYDNKPAKGFRLRKPGERKA